MNPIIHLSRSQWHRKLCVMVWILEAMQLDSPLYAIPLAKCWNLDCKYVDEVGRRRIHERNQQLLRQWQQLYVEVKVGYSTRFFFFRTVFFVRRKGTLPPLASPSRVKWQL